MSALSVRVGTLLSHTLCLIMKPMHLSLQHFQADVTVNGEEPPVFQLRCRLSGTHGSGHAEILAYGTVVDGQLAPAYDYIKITLDGVGERTGTTYDIASTPTGGRTHDRYRPMETRPSGERIIEAEFTEKKSRKS